MRKPVGFSKCSVAIFSCLFLLTGISSETYAQSGEGPDCTTPGGCNPELPICPGLGKGALLGSTPHGPCVTVTPTVTPVRPTAVSKANISVSIGVLLGSNNSNKATTPVATPAANITPCAATSSGRFVSIAAAPCATPAAKVPTAVPSPVSTICTYSRFGISTCVPIAASKPGH